ncbi:hypothetical protein BC829DRAFT_363920 [Chytridium lagenaria]|nr:hypothetical protein BC829DRAFT_363920 [Chytridium lagenaria]
MFRIGVDVVHLPRIHAVLQRKSPLKFAQKILCPEEITSFKRSGTGVNRTATDHSIPWRSLAIKEALYKAVFPTEKLTWKQVIVSSTGGKPIIEIKGLDLGDIDASLSHDGDYAMAAVIFQESKFLS